MNLINSILTSLSASALYEGLKSMLKMAYKKGTTSKGLIIVGVICVVVGFIAGTLMPDKWNPINLFKKKVTTP